MLRLAVLPLLVNASLKCKKVVGTSHRGPGQRHICRSIDANAWSMVGVLLDYRNAVLYDARQATVDCDKIQRLQNSLSQAKKNDRIATAVVQLPRLPITTRIKNKTALLANRNITTKQPEYISAVTDL
jgi:hypothetical protein